MTREETLAFIAGSEEIHYHVCRTPPTISEWVYSQYGEYVNSVGFPYIEPVRDWLIRRHDLALSEHESGRLRTLVYVASCEYEERRDKAQGWVEQDPAWLAAHEGQPVEVRIDSLLGDGVEKGTVRRVDGNLHVAPPRSRKNYYPLSAKVRPASGAARGEALKSEQRITR